MPCPASDPCLAREKGILQTRRGKRKAPSRGEERNRLSTLYYLRMGGEERGEGILLIPPNKKDSR